MTLINLLKPNQKIHKKWRVKFRKYGYGLLLAVEKETKISLEVKGNHFV